MTRLNRALPIALALLAAFPAAHAEYSMPPAALQAIVDAPRAPSLFIGPNRDIAGLVQTPSLPSIVEVAQPELKLAGVRINPRTYAASRFSFGTNLMLMNVADAKQVQVTGLPKQLRLADVAWSPDQRYLAFTNVSVGDANGKGAGVELWVVDVAAHKARRVGTQQLSAVFGRGFSWLPDSKGFIATLRVGGPAPQPSGIPTGPVVQESKGGPARQLRTYQDLLKNEEDAKIFEHYATSQLASIDLQGKVKAIGAPAIITSVGVSPNGANLLTTTVQRPFSYAVPVSSFARRIEVRDFGGKLVHLVAEKPVEEGLPPGNDAVSVGARSVTWRADAPATLVWAEAQDGGDPSKKADIRDHVYTLAAPFKAQPALLAKLESRYAGVRWGRGDLALITEYWWKTRALKEWRVRPDQPEAAADLAFSYSSEDRYNDPGDPVTKPDAAGNQRLVIGANDTLLLKGEGASPEGDRPFLDRYSLATKSKERLFHSAAPFYENVISVLDNDGKRILTTREAPTERPNYYVREGEALRAITSFPHPLPQLKEVQKEQIRYKRADGVDLTATLMLPPKYDAKRDGPLPMLMWAYPAEFKSAAAASQTTGSPYHFNAVSYWGPAAFLAMGYAVLDNPSFPIVGQGEAEPNDTYVPQLVADAEAAVEEVVKRGVADRHRIAVGGHSYGAFMTGNLLAHTRLFKAGIARSGAYNRTLTPFGFQSEERIFWKAKDTYQAMSPFNNAEKIKDALLLIHGEQDNNPGTFPVQSERMFHAVKGLGGTTRLVMLPNESHGYRARESIMTMLSETNAWLDKYVKNAKP